MIEETIGLYKTTFDGALSLCKVSEYEATKYKVSTTINKEELLKLKKQLTLLSFQLQDIASEYKTF